MPATISLTEVQIFMALGNALTTMGLVPATAGQPVAIVKGQVNRVPEVTGDDFVVMWPISRPRLSTNMDTYIDTQFNGSITGNVLTVANTLNGAAAVGQTLYGDGITPGCAIIAALSAPGTYAVTPTANVALETIYAGTVTATQEQEVVVQVDVHGPASADNVTRIATLWRDQFAADAFAAQGSQLTALYCADPIQLPFVNGEHQIEDRWVLTLTMQANIGITTMQQFADKLEITTTPLPIAAAA